MEQTGTRLSEEGFVADEIDEVVAVVRQKYHNHFEAVSMLNRLLTQAQYELTVRVGPPQDLTCAALYVRIIAHCQAVMILLERGMAPSARAMLRCAIEALFNLGACAADTKVALSWIDADPVDRRRRANYLAQVEDENARSQLEDGELDRILEQIQATIEEVEAHPVKTREMARLAGLEDWYKTAYAMLSPAVHSTAGDVDSHYRTDRSGRVAELLTEPSTDDLEGLFLVLGETMVASVRAMTKVFTMGVAAECEKELSRLQALFSDTTG